MWHISKDESHNLDLWVRKKRFLEIKRGGVNAFKLILNILEFFEYFKELFVFQFMRNMNFIFILLKSTKSDERKIFDFFSCVLFCVAYVICLYSRYLFDFLIIWKISMRSFWIIIMWRLWMINIFRCHFLEIYKEISYKIAELFFRDFLLFVLKIKRLLCYLS